MNFNPFDSFMVPPQPARSDAREDRQALTRAVFNTDAGRAWLAARMADEHARPSYSPGATFDQVAYAEGRKALLRDIAKELHDSNLRTDA